MHQRPIKVVSIASAGHSGSTLVGLVLDGHPHLLAAGELYALTQQGTVTSRGVSVASDALWGDAFTILRGHPVQVARSKGARLLGIKQYRDARTGEPLDVEAWGARYYEALSGCLTRSGAEVVVIASTYLGVDELELLINDARFDVSVIHLVRDGRAVARSYAKKRGRPCLWYMRWLAVNTKIRSVARGCSRYDLSYEAFTRDPQRVLREVCTYIGVTYQKEMLDFRKHEHNLVGGNRMRFAETSEIREDTAWRAQVPLCVRLLHMLTAPMRWLVTN